MSERLANRRRKKRSRRVSPLQSNSRSTRRNSGIDETVVIPDTPTQNGANSTCIDLTREEDDIEVTYVNDTSVVCLGEPETRTVTRSPDRSSINFIENIFDSILNPIVSLPLLASQFINELSNDYAGEGSIHSVSPVPHSSSSPGASYNTPLPQSTPVCDSPPPRSVSPRMIACSVCLEDHNQIRAHGKQLISTLCGHLFCKPCIQQAFKTKHACPSCRKKLTMKQIHPIYI